MNSTAELISRTIAVISSSGKSSDRQSVTNAVLLGHFLKHLLPPSSLPASSSRCRNDGFSAWLSCENKEKALKMTYQYCSRTCVGFESVVIMNEIKGDVLRTNNKCYSCAVYLKFS